VSPLSAASWWSGPRPSGIEPRGPIWLWAVVSALLVAGFVYLRLGVYPDRFVPIASILALLVCLWHRDVRLLWAMTAVFLGTVAYKTVVLVPAHGSVLGEEWIFGAMQGANLLVAAIVIHLALHFVARLETTVAEREAANQELLAREEDLARQNAELEQQAEELESQAEELEHQTEEISHQAEELQTLSGQLAQQEKILGELLEVSVAGTSEKETLRKLAETVERLLGERASGAALVEPTDAAVTVRSLFGIERGDWQIEPGQSVAAVILERNRPGGIADLDLRTDLRAPPLAGDKRARALAAAPLHRNGGGRGVLEVYSDRAGEWSDRDLRIVGWLAQQCGRMLHGFALKAQRDALLESERAARREAEKANRQKDEFVAILSHELRTPLNAILGWATVLRDGDGQDGSRGKGLEVIERHARRQGQLISDLLDISRSIAGKLELDLSFVELGAIAERAVESVQQEAEAGGVRIELDSGTGAWVEGDAARLEQVIWNLLSNAIKFTPAGGTVRIGLDRTDSQAVLTVTDSGEGIDSELLPRLFERYHQADGSSTRRHGGLGLGLAIVKELVDLHGGSVQAESDGPGHGSVFTIRLPLQAGDRRAAAEAKGEGPGVAGPLSSDSPGLEGMTVLVVDDEPDACELVSQILSARGASVHSAGSGRDALRMIDDVRPDILISDIGMPGMDGYAFIRAVRQRASDRSRPLPAIALTAFARVEDRSRALLAGYQSHVSKPVEVTELVAAVASLGYALVSRRTGAPEGE